MLNKKFLSATFIALAITGSVAFAAVQQGKVMYKQADGTYVVNTTTLTPTVKGFKGATPVEVYIKNNRLTLTKTIRDLIYKGYNKPSNVTTSKRCALLNSIS